MGRKLKRVVVHMRPVAFAKARKAAGMTQQQLADVLGLHVNTVYNYETGSTRIPKIIAEHMQKY